MKNIDRRLHLIKIVSINFGLEISPSLFEDLIFSIEIVENELKINMSDEQLITVMRLVHTKISTEEYPSNFEEIDMEIKQIVMVIADAILCKNLAVAIKEFESIMSIDDCEENAIE